MNTRLQVEHPVTEMVTGLDLVEWQLRIAQGEHLTIEQDDVTLTGHAIEARLYAEDPAGGYLPSTGTIHRWETPAGDAVRIDAGIETGSEVTPHYDPMIAKVIAHGTDREQARTRLIRALEDTTVLGPVTNRAMLLSVLREPAFTAGEATTAYLDEHPPAPPAAGTRELAALAACRYDARRRAAAARAHGLAGWSSTGTLESRQRLQAGDEVHLVVIRETADGVIARVDDDEHAVMLGGEAPRIDGATLEVRLLEPEPGRVLAAFAHLDLEVIDLGLLPPGSGATGGEGVLLAPMHGRVIAVHAETGSRVVAGQRLVVLEAMKMEHEIVADIDGHLEAIVGDGAQVAADQVLAQIEPAS